MTTEESLSYLYGLIPRGIKLGLKNISSVLNKLDDPQLKIPSIHIAGTNGKGSTAAFCESILRTAGFRVGLYTSPHLIHFSERIQINRIPLPENEMVDLINRVKKVVENLNISITFFEFSTVMAFLYFSNHKTNVNVIEVGMGGRLDATSLCSGDISIITSISQDHTAHLGDKIEEIAFEKASIIKDSGTVFAVNHNKKVVGVIKKVAKQKSANLQLLGEHFTVERRIQNGLSQSITYIQDKTRFQDLELSLIGDFQVNNACLAISASINYAMKSGINIGEQTIRTGLKSTRWDGRMEVISSNPTIILDSAHNPGAVKEVADSIEKLFSYARTTVVLGLMKDKESEKIIKILSNFGDKFILVRPKQERSENPKILKKILDKNKIPNEVIETIPRVLEKIKHFAKPDDMILITGSIFLVGEVKQYLINEINYKTTYSPSNNIDPNR